MAKRSIDLVSRRDFLHGATALGGSALLAKRIALGSDSTGKSDLPRRVLGKTAEKVPVLALGTAPCGQSKTVDTRSVIAIVNEALDLGVNYLDSARIYGNSEEAIGKALRGRRDEAFLTTKVWADDAEKARKSFEQSLRELQTDFVDLVFVHSVGNREVDRVTADDGALKYLLGQKEAGKARYVGISGHSRSPSFVPLLESGDIDVAMLAMNFVDRYTYKFESQVLPVANRHNVGVACMKVFGGIRGGFSKYGGPNPGSQMAEKYFSHAVRYAMELPGVATLVIGPHTVEQLRENVRMVKDAQPLTDAERSDLDNIGKQLAAQWGPRFGPAV